MTLNPQFNIAVEGIKLRASIFDVKKAKIIIQEFNAIPLTDE